MEWPVTQQIDGSRQIQDGSIPDSKLETPGGGGSFPNPFALTADITPTALTADVDDYAPTGGATADVWRMTTDGANYNVNGITGGADGRILIIHNVPGGSGVITFKDSALTSAAANRIDTVFDIPLYPGRTVTFIYDGTASRWKELVTSDATTVQGAKMGAGIGLSTEGDMLVFTADGQYEALPPNEVVDGYLAEAIQDVVGAMFSGNTETGITATYQDTDGTIDLEVSGSSADGWLAGTGTWSYSSADAPTFVISIDADVTALIGVGDRIKLTQTTAKYFIVTAVGTFSAGATLVTVYGGTDYILANAAITSPYYSHMKSPFGFPLNPTKWTVSFTDTSDRFQASPTINTWYNPGSLSISIPIGCWSVEYFWQLYGNDNSTVAVAFGSLSTANNSESDSDLTRYVASQATGATDLSAYAPATCRKTLLLASKTTYYAITKTSISGQANLGFNNASAKMIIRAVCAYL